MVLVLPPALVKAGAIGGQIGFVYCVSHPERFYHKDLDCDIVEGKRGTN